MVFSDFDEFLIDHAACERKASAAAMSLLAHYPDRKTLADAMVDFALEELTHFKQVYQILCDRGLALGADRKDQYVGAIRKLVRTGREEYFMDRLLVMGLIEARGCERFGLIRDALPEGDLKSFYAEITRSEASHHGLFLRLAKTYFSDDAVEERLEFLLDAEAGNTEKDSPLSLFTLSECRRRRRLLPRNLMRKKTVAMGKYLARYAEKEVGIVDDLPTMDHGLFIPARKESELLLLTLSTIPRGSRTLAVVLLNHSKGDDESVARDNDQCLRQISDTYGACQKISEDTCLFESDFGGLVVAASDVAASLWGR